MKACSDDIMNKGPAVWIKECLSQVYELEGRPHNRQPELRILMKINAMKALKIYKIETHKCSGIEKRKFHVGDR